MIVLITALLLPLLFRMLTNLHEGKEELRAYRMLYEHVEEYVVVGSSEVRQRRVEGVDYEFYMQSNGQGGHQMCVAYENNELCVE